MHHYVLETERLILRPLSRADRDAVFEWVSDEDVARYVVYHPYTDIDNVEKWLMSVEESDSTYDFGFVRREDGLLIGSGDIGPDRDRKGYWAFGYNLRKDCWGKGYATEAARAMISFVMQEFGIHHFSCSHVDVNGRSGRVIEKCGLHFVGYGEFRKLDGSCPMRSMEYEGEIDEMRDACIVRRQ